MQRMLPELVTDLLLASLQRGACLFHVLDLDPVSPEEEARFLMRTYGVPRVPEVIRAEPLVGDAALFDDYARAAHQLVASGLGIPSRMLRV